MECQLSALTVWPEAPTTKPRKGQFRVTYSDLLSDLKEELRLLKAANIELQLYVPETKLRSIRRKSDGWPSADARTIKPGCVLSFSSTSGDLQFACDTYADAVGGGIGWQDNLRAISLTLERLRDIDRYGATKSGQQYKGYAALPPAPKTRPVAVLRGVLNAGVSDEDLNAASLLARHSGAPKSKILTDEAMFKQAYRQAAVNVHPDKPGGNSVVMAQVNAAVKVLERRFVK